MIFTLVGTVVCCYGIRRAANEDESQHKMSWLFAKQTWIPYAINIVVFSFCIMIGSYWGAWANIASLVFIYHINQKSQSFIAKLKIEHETLKSFLDFMQEYEAWTSIAPHIMKLRVGDEIEFVKQETDLGEYPFSQGVILSMHKVGCIVKCKNKKKVVLYRNVCLPS